MSPLRPRMNIQAVMPLTRIPAVATQMTVPSATGSGLKRRPIAPTAMAPTATRSSIALVREARIDELPKP